MYEQLKDNWSVNYNNNLLVIDHLLGEHMTLKLQDRGRSIDAILKHMQKNKISWIQHLTPRIKGLNEFEQIESMEERENMLNQFIIELIQIEEAGTKVKGFKSDLFGFIVYLISHDSHHRGQIFQILRNNGIKLDPKLQYGIWEWNRK